MPDLKLDPRFHLPINGVDYTVGIASRDALDGLAGESDKAEGLTAPQQALIVIAEDVPDHRRPAVFWHEYFHAAWGESGSRTYAHMVGCAPDQADESQERLCCFLGPILAATLDGPHAIERVLAGPCVQSTKGSSARKADARGRSKGAAGRRGDGPRDKVRRKKARPKLRRRR